MQCSKCGFYNLPGAHYCLKCGWVPAPTSDATENKQSVIPKLFWAGVGLAVLLAMISIASKFGETPATRPLASSNPPATDVAKNQPAPVANTSSPTQPAPVEPPASKWSYNHTSSEMNSSTGYVAWLKAENEIQGWLQSSTPVLFVRCHEGKIELYINVDMPANVEYGGGHTVRLRFDDTAPVKQSWGESTDNKALFARDAITLAKNLSTAETLRFEFVPFNASPQIVQFDVRGFKPHLDEILSVCRKH